MAQIQTIGAGLNPDDLWRNLFWLRDRLEKVEAQCRNSSSCLTQLTAQLSVLSQRLDRLDWPPGKPPSSPPVD